MSPIAAASFEFQGIQEGIAIFCDTCRNGAKRVWNLDLEEGGAWVNRSETTESVLDHQYNLPKSVEAVLRAALPASIAA
jgi:hypothetical protein